MARLRLRQERLFLQSPDLGVPGVLAVDFFFEIASEYLLMGQLIRIIIIVLALGLVLHYVRRALVHRRRSADPSPDRPARMLTCAVCGTHIPESEAMHAAGKVYCSEEHRRGAGSG